MLNRLVITHVLIAVLVFASPSSKAQETVADNVPALLVQANNAYIAEDYTTFRNALEGLNKMRPYNSEYMYQLVLAYALLDEKTKAYDLMLRMQKQGLSYDFTATDNTLNIRDTQVFDYVSELLKLAGDPMGESEHAFVLPGTVIQPETISWDESRQKFLVGTVAEGTLLAVDDSGQVTELLRANDENGLWAIFDIIVDQANNRLWVSSASVPGFLGFDPVDKGRSALFEFDLKSLELIHRYPTPVDGAAHVLGNMVLSSKGDVFIADRNLPFIYTKAAGEKKLKPVVVLERMVSLRGLAMQPDGRILYVADREMGIMIIDVKARKIGRLKVPETLNLGGIDGLYLKDNRLFVIQNGIKPQRVMRLQLNSSGTEVTSVRPLAVALPEFDYPSFGTLKNDHLYYFANSQWSGKAESREVVTVLRTVLDANEELIPAESRQFMEEQARKMRQTSIESTDDTDKN